MPRDRYRKYRRRPAGTRQNIRSEVSELRQMVDLLAHPQYSTHFERETYTWQLRQRARSILVRLEKQVGPMPNWVWTATALILPIGIHTAPMTDVVDYLQDVIDGKAPAPSEPSTNTTNFERKAPRTSCPAKPDSHSRRDEDALGVTDEVTEGDGTGSQPDKTPAHTLNSQGLLLTWNSNGALYGGIALGLIGKSLHLLKMLAWYRAEKDSGVHWRELAAELFFGALEDKAERSLKTLVSRLRKRCTKAWNAAYLIPKRDERGCYCLNLLRPCVHAPPGYTPVKKLKSHRIRYTADNPIKEV